MKQMKKMVSMVLTVIMVFAMAISAAAAEPEKGTIKVDNAAVGKTYTIYKILTLESYNTSGAYSYKAATEQWATFINSADTYVNVDENGYVTWKEGADVADFAKLAQKYAIENHITNNGQKTAETPEIRFENLELGYYLLDSNMGTLCALDTTNPIVTVGEKNKEPTLIKEVKEDSDKSWGNAADADRDQEVEFRATITAKKGAQNYIMHDKMDEGLEFKTESVSITVKRGDAEPVTLTANTDYTQDDGGSTCTFHINFSQTFCDTLNDDDIIVVSYRARVDKMAFLSNKGTNEAHLTYGDENKFTTTPSEVTVSTWQIPIYKYFKDNGTEKPLAGATFELYRDADLTNKVVFEERTTTEDTAIPLYRVKETGTVTEITTEDIGKFILRGLDSGTYYLKETQAPTGYNKLPKPVRIKVTVTDGNAVVTYGDTDADADSSLGVKIENKTGSLLPTTGGIGTTIFYIVGGILVVGAVVFLVTKKRMGVEK